MAINVADLIAGKKDLTITFAGTDAVLHIAYNPEYYTDAFVQEADRLSKDDSVTLYDFNCWQFSQIVREWDLVSGPKGKEKPVPLTPEGIKKSGLSATTIARILQLVIEDNKPGERIGAISSAS